MKLSITLSLSSLFMSSSYTICKRASHQQDSISHAIFHNRSNFVPERKLLDDGYLSYAIAHYYLNKPKVAIDQLNELLKSSHHHKIELWLGHNYRLAGLFSIYRFSSVESFLFHPFLKTKIWVHTYFYRLLKRSYHSSHLWCVGEYVNAIHAYTKFLDKHKVALKNPLGETTLDFLKCTSSRLHNHVILIDSKHENSLWSQWNTIPDDVILACIASDSFMPVMIIISIIADDCTIP